MTEREVEVSDEFTVDCPGCRGDDAPFLDDDSGRLRSCPVCRGTGKVQVYVEGSTTVEIDPPDRE